MLRYDHAVRKSDPLSGAPQLLGGNSTDFRLGLAVLVASGMAALGHEVLWTRRMIDLLGASSESSARVFECFFFGLCFGAAATSLLLPRIRRHWRLLGYVEVGVAILSVPAILLPQWTAWVWPSLGPEKLVGWQGSVLKTVFSMLIVLPPTFLMGMTLPVMVSAIVSAKPKDSSREVLLYAANTVGGVFGLSLVILVSLRFLGCAGSMLLTMAINLAVAAACFLKNGQRKGQTDAAAGRVVEGRTAVPPGTVEALPLVFAFISGAGVLGLEVLGLALANLSAPLSIYPQGSILMCVILVLALAAFLVARIAGRLGNLTQILSIATAAACLAAALFPVVFLHLPGVTLGLFGYGRDFGHFLMTLTGDMLVSLGPAMLCAGIVFPVVVLWATREGSLPGRQLALLLAVNGLGGIAGTEIAYRLLLPNLAVHVSIGVIAVCYGLASLGVLLVTKEKRIARYAWPAAAFLISCYVTNAVLTELPVYYKANMYKVVDLRSGREGSLAVVEDGRSRVMVFDNQYTLGGTWVTASLRRQAHLPLLLHPAPTKVGFIGLGTGITASGALEHKAVQSVTVVELSRLVAEAAARDFDPFNHQICRNPKAKVYIEDARVYLESSRDSFDVIVGDLFIPWRPGEASLCSLEEFQAAKNALRKGGVFCQWIELTQWTPEQFQVALATFRKVFGKVYLFRTGFETGAVPIGLVGFKDGGGPDWGTVARRCEFEARQGQLADPLCRHQEGVAMLFLGEPQPPASRGTQINTLNNLFIEVSASREVVLVDSLNYYKGDGPLWLDLLDRQTSALANDQAFPTALRPYPRLGGVATRFEIALAGKDAASKVIADALVEQVPSAIRTDPGANWTLWAGSVTPWGFLTISSGPGSTKSSGSPQ